MPRQRKGWVEIKVLLYASRCSVSVIQMCWIRLAFLMKCEYVEIEQLRGLGAAGPIEVSPLLRRCRCHKAKFGKNEKYAMWKKMKFRGEHRRHWV